MNHHQNVLELFQMGGFIMYPIAILGFIATVIFFDKLIKYTRNTCVSSTVRDSIRSFDFSWDKLHDELSHLNDKNIYKKFLSSICANKSHPSWFIESRADEEGIAIQKKLHSGQWLLETITTAAPLLGLLGTIFGMMRSFKFVSLSSLARPEQVTGGVAESLIATAFGIIVGLLALFAFNYLSKRNEEIISDLESLGGILLKRIKSQAK